MVFLAITPRGLTDALRQAEGTGAPVWCGAEAISEEDFGVLDARDVTRFDHALDWRDLPGALGTIAEHHPGHVVWVEAAPIADGH